MGPGFPQRSVLKVFLMIFCPSLVSPLHFHMTEREQKCFIEEIPADTVVIGGYWTRLYDEPKDEYLPATQHLNISVAARAPDDQLILSHTKGSKGKFNFTSVSSGEHKICLQPNLSQPLSAGLIVVVYMDIQSGQRTINYTEVHERDRLTVLQLRVRQLADQVQQIQKELIYQKVCNAVGGTAIFHTCIFLKQSFSGHLQSREEDFRATNRHIYMWIYWWPILRFVFVVAFLMPITAG
uniref:Transmembrane emp24 domain-containing protein 9 n=1 Tax=Fundulus heteroclitus TaxID=8078 RepID=A0A3Q2QLN9_FUNHE